MNRAVHFKIVLFTLQKINLQIDIITAAVLCPQQTVKISQKLAGASPRVTVSIPTLLTLFEGMHTKTDCIYVCRKPQGNTVSLGKEGGTS